MIDYKSMFTAATRFKLQYSRRGQSTIILIVIALILLIIGIIVAPRVMRRLNIKLPNIPRPRLTAVDVSPQPTTDKNVLPAQTTQTASPSGAQPSIAPCATSTGIQATSAPSLFPPSTQPTGIPCAAISPSPDAMNFIAGEIRIVNHSDRFIEKVEVHYCGQASISKENQTCTVTDFKNEGSEANTVWYLYNSVSHYYYHYQLNFDAYGNPMVKGRLYMIAWAQATVDGQTFQSDEKWVNAQYPGKKNFTVVLPSK